MKRLGLLMGLGLALSAVAASRYYVTADADKQFAAPPGLLASNAPAIAAAVKPHLSIDASNVVSGVLPVARIATGTPDGSKFVRDDGVLAVPPGGSSGLLVNSALVPGANLQDNWWGRWMVTGTNLVGLPQEQQSVTSASWSPDFSQGLSHRVVLNGNLVLGAPLGVTEEMVGLVFRLILVQDATGGRTVDSVATNYVFGREITGIGLSTNANSRSYVPVMVVATNRFDIGGSLTGYL